jgi:hypothetical protein
MWEQKFRNLFISFGNKQKNRVFYNDLEKAGALCKLESILLVMKDDKKSF